MGALNERQRAEVTARYAGGASLESLSREFDTSVYHVRKAIKDAGVPFRPPVRARRSLTPEQTATALRMYDEGAWINAIAAALRVRNERVRDALVANGVKLRPATHTRHFDDATEAEIVRRYENGEPASALGRQYGCARSTVVEIVRRRTGRVRSVGNERRQFTEEERDLIRRLWAAKRTRSEIAEALRTNTKVVDRLAEELGLRNDRHARRERHGAWHGGRVRMKSGYVGVLVDPDDPFASMRSTTGYVPEHRLVMARHLGRPLAASEQVHHVNGDRTDNRIENLQLRQGHHGAGVVYRCRRCGSTDIEAVPIASANDGGP